MRTTFPLKNGEYSVSDTVPTQNNLENGDADMAKWPKRVKHWNRVLAKIYRPCRGRDSYRVTWYAAGKRQMKSFPTFAGSGGAKAFAETLVKELAKNSQALLLSPSQESDALAAIERLGTFYQPPGAKFPCWRRYLISGALIFASLANPRKLAPLQENRTARATLAKPSGQPRKLRCSEKSGVQPR